MSLFDGRDELPLDRIGSASKIFEPRSYSPGLYACRARLCSLICWNASRSRWEENALSFVPGLFLFTGANNCESFEMSLNTRRVSAVIVKGVEFRAGDRV